MSLKPIGGDAKSQDLNDNFAYLDTKPVEPAQFPANSIPSSKLKNTTDDDKVGLANLKTEVISAMSGASPTGTIPTDGSVTAVKISNEAVTSSKLAAGSVTEVKLAAGAVTASKIAQRGISDKNLPGYLAAGEENKTHFHMIDETDNFLMKRETEAATTTTVTAFGTFPGSVTYGTPSNVTNMKNIVFNVPQGYSFNTVRLRALLITDLFTGSLLVTAYQPKPAGAGGYTEEDIIAQTVISQAEVNSGLNLAPAGLANAQYLTYYSGSYVDATFDENLANEATGGIDIMFSVVDEESTIPTVFVQGTAQNSTCTIKGLTFVSDGVFYPWATSRFMAEAITKTTRSLSTKVEEIVADTGYIKQTDVYLTSDTAYISTEPIGGNVSDLNVNTSYTYAGYQSANQKSYALKIQATEDLTLRQVEVPLGIVGAEFPDPIPDHFVKVYSQALSGDPLSPTVRLILSDEYLLTQATVTNSKLLETATLGSTANAVAANYKTSPKTTIFDLAEPVHLVAGESCIIEVGTTSAAAGILVITSTVNLSSEVFDVVYFSIIGTTNTSGWGINQPQIALISETSNTSLGEVLQTSSTLTAQVDKLNFNRYCDVLESRKAIADFLSRLWGREKMKVVVYGDSIVNFQNSETLSVELQKTAPIGLAGNSFLRQLWKILNYDVYDDDRSVLSENGNMGFKRFDHSDCVFSNGYQGTALAIGTKDWATNRSDSADAWRARSFSSYPQVITPESSYNKPMVGSIEAGATFTVTIPSEAIGCAIVFGRGSTRASNVNVKINNGATDVVDETINLVDMDVVELHKEYTLTAGTVKTITVTNVSGNELWVWGVEYWTGPCIMVLNSGLAGNNSNSLNSNFDLMVGNQDPDFVVTEFPTLNDTNSITETACFGYASSLIEKLNALAVPILAIFPHRFLNGSYNLQYNRDNIIYDATNFPIGSKLVGNRYFFPNYIKIYKAITAKYNFGLIDMYAKSVDDLNCGNTNFPADVPAGYYVDNGHLGPAGNASYVEEFKKIFLWDDVE